MGAWKRAPPPNSKCRIPMSAAISIAGRMSSVRTLPPNTLCRPSRKAVSMTRIFLGLLAWIIAGLSSILEPHFVDAGDARPGVGTLNRGVDGGEHERVGPPRVVGRRGA